MTGPEHYREAERLINQANRWANADMGWKAHLTSAERIGYRTADLAEAQVHATLAAAAATALNDADGGLDFLAWLDAAGMQSKGGASE